MNPSDFYAKRRANRAVFDEIQAKIESLVEGDFITYVEECEFIEALVRLSEARHVLELGMYTGFGTLHMIRGVYPDGKVVSVENRPNYDTAFFGQPHIKKCFEFVEGTTPQALATTPVTRFAPFDLVFIDSDHGLEHTDQEIRALFPITKPGTVFVFHDCPKRQNRPPEHDGVLHRHLKKLVRDGVFEGTIFPTPYASYLEKYFGANYSKDLTPHLGVFRRPD